MHMATTETNRSGSSTPFGTPDTVIPHDTPVHAPDGGKRPLFDRLARFSVRRRRPVMLVWAAVVLLAAPLAIGVSGALSGAGWEAQGSTAQKVRDELRSDFPMVGAESAIVVVNQPSAFDDDPSVVAELVAALSAEVGGDMVAGLADPTQLPPEAGLVSPDGRTIMIPVSLAYEADADLPEAAADLIHFVEGRELPSGVQAEVTGEWPVWSDFNHANESALHKAELLSGLPTLVLLFVAFGAALAAGIPLILAIAGIAVGFASLNLLTSITPLSVWSMNFSMMIGLAVGIDYSLFIVTRYREEREDGHSCDDAMANALMSSGKAVFLSALTVIMSLAAIFVVPIMVFRSMALGMILSVTAVALASLTLLPAVLAAMGDRVLVNKGEPDLDRASEGRWARWTGAALKRPGLTLVLGLVLLLGLGAPAIGMDLGMPGARVVDRGESSRDGYELVTSAFGEGAAAPLFVTTPIGTENQVVDAMLADENVIAAQTVATNESTGRAVVRAFGRTGPEDERTGEMVGRIRDSLAVSVPAAEVGGPASQNYDLTETLTGKAPLAVVLIMVVAFLLLLLVFRSVAIAVSSILLNLIGVAASFGFATIVFQHGIGAGLLGIEHQGFVNAWAPIFFFALLFGLSMDYQLFLLAAIRERFEATGDTQRAIREGIAMTGRPITNAALIMIVVFVAFGVTGPIPPTELGVTLALAVLLDATVIRMMLVPSVMGLLGRHNWWIPKWLDKRLPKVHFSH
jgi:RND superfamily putative drug exporter